MAYLDDTGLATFYNGLKNIFVRTINGYAPDSNGDVEVWPVGSIYISTNSTSPASMFGGSWTRIEGKFLLGATDNGSSGAAQAAGNTGGSSEHYHWTNQGDTDGTGNAYFRTNTSGISRRSISDQAHRIHEDAWVNPGTFYQLSTYSAENIPPYLSVYIWQRVS